MKKNVMLMVPLLDQGGLERICALTANLLKDKCNLTLVVFSTKNMLYDVSKVEMIDLHLGSKPGIMGKIITLFRRIHSVKRIKKQKQIDVTYSFGPSANLTNVFSKVKDQIWVGIRGYGALEDKKAMTRLSKRADKVVCCSQIMADDVKRIYHPKEVTCLYNPCDVEEIQRLGEEPIDSRFESFFEGEGPIIASMGREHDVKGFWHLVKAFAIVNHQKPNAKLIIVGEGTFTDYKKLALDLGIADKILFTGVQKNPFRYIKKASLYVLTSSSEGFPNALVEAMALGVPVMSVNCKSGPAEILLEDYREASDVTRVYEGKYGILLPVMSPEKNLNSQVVEKEEKILAEQMIGILTDYERSVRLRKYALERSNQFTTVYYLQELLTQIGLI